MKFQKGDTVKVVANKERLEEISIYNLLFHGFRGKITNNDNEGLLSYSVSFPKIDDRYYFAEQDLELVERESETAGQSEIRKFDTGATRDTVEGKLSYVRVLSPITLRRYVEYMNFHAKQSDGIMREPDNWKNGFPIETYLDSLGRHFVAVWLLQQGFTETDNHGSVTLEDSLCGIIFNAMGWLHEILKKKQEKFVVPKGWVIELTNSKNGWTIWDQQHTEFLWKDLTVHYESTGYSKFLEDNKREPQFGEAPGHWPTEKAAKGALKQYLEKTKKASIYCKHCEEKIHQAKNGDAVGLCGECSKL